jgi:hypothetical protein
MMTSIFVTLLSAISADASVMAVGTDAFPAASTLITFTGQADNTEVNGLSVDGILFSYSLGDDILIIDGGPGVTDHIDPPNIVAVGNPSGILTLTLPGFFNAFGYGYAILNTLPVSDATTITLFNGTTNVGTLSYNGVPDPLFSGGFAGIRSTIPFNSVAINFNSMEAPSFALDNIQIAGAIPEPSTILLMLSGAVTLFWRAKRKI